MDKIIYRSVPNTSSKMRSSSSSSSLPSISRDDGFTPSLVTFGAASVVAHQPDSCMAVSAAVGAKEVGRLRSLVQLPLLLFCSSVVQQLPPLLFPPNDSLSHCPSPSAAIVCKRFPGFGVDACRFHATLAGVLKTQSWMACWSASCG